MMESSSVRPAIRSASNLEYAGRSGRRSEPVKSFPTDLERSKTGPSVNSASRNGTSASRASNSGILAAIGAKTSASRQDTVAPGTRRPPTETPRETPVASPAAPAAPAAATPKFNSMQQSWLDANTGAYANLLKANLSRTQPFQLDAVDIRWANVSTGNFDSTTRAVGNVTDQSGKELADLFGGTLVKSPFNTFGTAQKDQYIRMPTGQMVEASVLANQLNAARTASDPFSATQSVLEIYQHESQTFDLNRSTNAIDLITKRTLSTGVGIVNS